MIVSAVIGLLATLAIPSFLQSRVRTQTNTCLNNLRIISGAKSLFALENFRTDGDTVIDSDLDPYLRTDLADMVEPSSGTYTVGPIGVPPTCSIGGDHILSL